MKIAIMGYGVVGKGVEKIAVENGIQVGYILMRESALLSKANMCTSLEPFLEDKEVTCVVECIGNDEPAHRYVLRCMECGKNVISANKKMIAAHFKELLDCAKKNRVSFLFSAACGGAIPWLSELNRIQGTDRLLSFKGIMNGTCNYILNRIVADGIAFEQALKEAQQLGYAEQDPSDDIDGTDTACKLILSMGVGFSKQLLISDLFVQGIRDFSEQERRFMKEYNYKCVLLGQGNPDCAYVIPTFVSPNSIFHHILSNNNCFQLNGENIGSLSLIGQGAGSLPSASNIIRDMARLNHGDTVELKETLKPDYSKKEHMFYLRTENTVDSDLIEKNITHNSYMTKKISIAALRSMIGEHDFAGEIIDD